MSVGAIRAGRAMVEIFADSSQLARGLASAQSKMAKFAQTIRRLGATQVVIGVSIAAPIAAAIRQYAQLEQKINTVRSVTGATVGQMRGLTQQIRQIGMATGQPFTQIAEGMGDLARAGVKIQDLGKATRVIADFSRAASVDMARAANIGVQVLTEFGLSMEHLPRVADVLQEMANATVSNVEDLGDGFRYAGQSAKLFGLTLEQAGSAIAYLQQSGLSASTAGTALNQMLLQMVGNLDKLEGAIGGIRNADGDFIPFNEILNKLRDTLKDMPRPERLNFLNKMFDVRGMRGAAAMLEDIEGWMALNKQAENSMGASKRKALEMSQAFIVSFERMTNGLTDFAYAIGETLDGDLRAIFGTLANFASGLAPFVKANAEAVRSVAKFAAGLTVSGVAFFTVGISLQLLAFAFEGFVKAALAAISPITMVAKAAQMLGVAFTASAAKVTGAAGAILGSVTRLYAAVARPIDAAAAAILGFGTAFSTMSRTVAGSVGRAVAAIRVLNQSVAAGGVANAARGAAAAAPQVVANAAAGAAAATAGAGRAAAAPVAAVAASGLVPAAVGRAPRVRRLPRGEARTAPSGPRSDWFMPNGMPFRPGDDIVQATQMTRRQRQRAARDAAWFAATTAGRTPSFTLRGLPQEQQTARQMEIARRVAENRQRRASGIQTPMQRDAADARRARMRELLVENNVRRMAANVAPAPRPSSLFSFNNPANRAVRSADFNIGATFTSRMMTRARLFARDPISTMFSWQTRRRGRQAMERVGGAIGAAGNLLGGPMGLGSMLIPQGAGRMAGAGLRGLAVGGAAMALPALKIGAAIAAASVAAAALRKSFAALTPFVKAIGTGLQNAFGPFIARAKTVMPEILATVKTGWRGVSDAINAGDLSLAWRVFADTAKAVFAEIMVILGPFVDDVTEIFEDIVDAVSGVLTRIVDVAKSVFDEIRAVAAPAFDFLADLGDTMLEGFASAVPAVSDLLGTLGGIAEDTGNRIFEALSSGDIVKAWSAATTAIGQMFVVLGSEWEKYVAKPIQLSAIRAVERRQEDSIRQELLRNDINNEGEQNAQRASNIFNAQTPDELRAAVEAARPTMDRLKTRADAGSEQAASSLRAMQMAIDMVTARFKQLGMVTEEARRAEVAKKVAELDKQFEDGEKARADRRAKNAEERRANADRAASRAAGGAGTAEEKRARGDLSRRIADATTPEELDKAQQELDAMRRRATAAENEAGIKTNLGSDIDNAVWREEDSPEQFAQKKQEAIDAAKKRLADIGDAGAAAGMSEKDIAAYRASDEKYIKEMEAAVTAEHALRASSDSMKRRAEITASRGDGATDINGWTAQELRDNAQGVDVGIRNNAVEIGARQEQENAARAKAAEELRMKAAEARRGGDEPTAKRLEESAKALETAVDALEGASLQQEINQQRQALAAEQELRAKQAQAGGKAAMASKELDSVGGFMSSAFDRLGYSSNLAERQAKAAEAGAAGIAKLVGFAERGGLFV